MASELHAPTLEEIAHYKAIRAGIWDAPDNHPVWGTLGDIGTEQLEDILPDADELAALRQSAAASASAALDAAVAAGQPEGSVPPTEPELRLHERWARAMAGLARIRARWPELVPPRATPPRTALQLFSPVAVRLLDRGARRPILTRTLEGVSLVVNETPWWAVALASVGGVAAAIHGYRRNRGSVGWALAWGLGGTLLPLPVLAVAVLQGFGRSRWR